MKARFAHFPISVLLLNTLNASGVKPQQFFEEIGYTNYSKALESLDAWLKDGVGNSLLIKRIQSSRFAIPDEVLQSELGKTEEIHRLEKEQIERDRFEFAKANFRPHLEVVPELSRPTQIFLYGMSGGNRRFSTVFRSTLPNEPLEIQYQTIKKTILENFEKHKGRTIFMGKIVAYLYFQKFNEKPIRFTTAGELDDQSMKTVQAGEVSIRIR